MRPIPVRFIADFPKNIQHPVEDILVKRQKNEALGEPFKTPRAAIESAMYIKKLDLCSRLSENVFQEKTQAIRQDLVTVFSYYLHQGDVAECEAYLENCLEENVTIVQQQLNLSGYILNKAGVSCPNLIKAQALVNLAIDFSCAICVAQENLVSSTIYASCENLAQLFGEFIDNSELKGAHEIGETFIKHGYPSILKAVHQKRLAVDRMTVIYKAAEAGKMRETAKINKQSFFYLIELSDIFNTASKDPMQFIKDTKDSVFDRGSVDK